MEKYKKQARRARKKVLQMIYKAQTSHIGSNFSCIDILTVLFRHINIKSDKFIASKGWAAAAVYYFLSEVGVIHRADLSRFCQEGEKEYIGLIEPHGKFGLEFAGGSMGYGIAAGVGFALTKKLRGENGRVYVLASDGEMNCGTTWEAAMIAAHHKLDNLTVIVDANGFQAMGETDEVLNTEPLGLKWKMFGWDTKIVNGHSFEDIERGLYPNENSDIYLVEEAPRVVIARTTKGKGVSYMEDDNLWHYWHISDENYNKALSEL